jgi:deazaflavin-dependent oxidoreductase (nitroreductase family)
VTSFYAADKLRVTARKGHRPEGAGCRSRRHSLCEASRPSGAGDLVAPIQLARRVFSLQPVGVGCGRTTAMRSRKYRIVTTVERLNNRLIRFALRKGIAPRAFALLETTGRRTGLPRHTPIGNGRIGDTFWLVAVHGTQSDHVRNLQVHPAVRVKIGHVWRTGMAVVLPDDDAVARSRTLPYQWDAALGRLMASSPLTIRIDLDRNG